VVVAALVLSVGVLATVGLVAGATRDAGRARSLEGAAEVAAERVARWRGAPCAEAAGERAVGALRERWRVTVAGGAAVLADTVEVPEGAARGGTARVGVVALAGCGP
jgi:Tfp pilus assembly protein PilV